MGGLELAGGSPLATELAGVSPLATELAGVSMEAFDGAGELNLSHKISSLGLI